MYYLDTYAIIEIIEKNKNYKKYEAQRIITSSMNIAELYWTLINRHNKKTADFWINRLSFDLIGFSEIDCIEAVNYRYSRKKDKLSFTDCLGYVLSLKNDLKFLTGDEKFEKENNVEFVKK